MENWLSLATALGLGGSLGALLAFLVAGRKFAGRLRSLISSLEKALLDMRRADLNALRDEMVLVEQEARRLFGLLSGLLKGR
ncbi:MAG: hypothetical protein IT207_11270 [Fimbriimonadaceae bacterium]|nr:hypothetical protein [Fimbriimonadaceae bacterium]